MEKFEMEKQEDDKDEKLLSPLVSNGTRDIHGKVADKRKTGRWKAASFIIVSQVAENVAYIAIAVNLITYLITQMKLSLPTSVALMSTWAGLGNMLTVVGAVLGDGYLGRFQTVLLASCCYMLGLLVLTLSASIDSLRPPPCKIEPCQTASVGQILFLCAGLGLLDLGTGGLKPCIPSFGGDQFDEADEKEKVQKSSFFDWVYFSLNMGALFSVTVVVYVLEKKGWSWSFGLLTAATFLSIIILVVGLPFYRFQRTTGSAFTRFLQVIVASLRNHMKGAHVGDGTQLYELKTPESDIKDAPKLPHTQHLRFLDKAAVRIDPEADTNSRWRLCTVTQVEELKCLIRIFPMWIIGVLGSVSYTQFTTFFIGQAKVMDRQITSNFAIPAASTPIIFAVNAIVLIPLYDNVIVPALRKYTGNPHGITTLQRIGVGFFVSILALASAAIVERQRRDTVNSTHTNMSVLWLLPQFILLGTAEMLAFVAQMEFFYSEATVGTRSISSAVFQTQLGTANILNGLIVSIITNATGGERKGWLRNDLNHSKLDYYYWILTALNGFSFLIYMWHASHYKGRSGSVNPNSVKPVNEVEDTQ
ncbi:protein NRT1/ PTR FAMILY 8.2-like [Jatropha curcas]|uniref:protein NRT1/ PTR FAMILY 8.2-like n=1 Tax=Jatropha curcas TaxID=180498 RepID=UPI0005FAF4D8|nr:protein NRT1/ PTR FAMILY 8.2-like [Jatropha curcas]